MHGHETPVSAELLSPTTVNCTRVRSDRSETKKRTSAADQSFPDTRYTYTLDIAVIFVVYGSSSSSSNSSSNSIGIVDAVSVVTIVVQYGV